MWKGVWGWLRDNSGHTVRREKDRKGEDRRWEVRGVLKRKCIRDTVSVLEACLRLDVGVVT
jgi:hypothetical protein